MNETITNETTLTITMEQLFAAFSAWEKDRRNGLCMEPDEVDGMPVGQVAAVSAEVFWGLLVKEGASER